MWWNENRIRWYEEASLSSDFQQRLTDEIEKSLKKDWKIAEIGCGLGHITEELTNRGYSVTGYDIDEPAIMMARLRTGRSNYLIRDCIDDIPNSDVILSVFFGHYGQDEDYLLKAIASSKRLIIASNMHTGQTKGLREHRPFLPFLEKHGIRYDSRMLSISFDQRLSSLEDARCFIADYYPTREQEVESHLIQKGDSYILENKKEILLTTVFSKEEP
jgi:2-polyprenyl-3-methyl-5-hydroxy-6-metoxy-1,4-benzoquinol methylase